MIMSLKYSIAPMGIPPDVTSVGRFFLFPPFHSVRGIFYSNPDCALDVNTPFSNISIALAPILPSPSN